MAVEWTRLDDVLARLRKRWVSGEFLKGWASGAPLEPAVIPLRGPSTAALSARFDDVRDWVALGKNARNEITSDDLLALSMLGVNVPAHATLCITGHQRDEVASLLAEIPDDVDLADESADRHINKSSPGWNLWDLLCAHEDIGMTVASKIMARKRPRLIPVQDSVVRAAVGWHPKKDFWTGMRTLLTTGDPNLVSRLHRIRDKAGTSVEFSDLRVFDISVWMAAHSDH